MVNQEILEKVKEIVSTCLKDKGLELVEMKCHGKNRPVLAILADRREGGITIDECASVNNAMSEALDAADIFDSGYVLEVSSPGVDRPLKEKDDFSRVINKKVRCFFKEPIHNRYEIEGVVKEINDQSVSLDTDDGFMEIPYTGIRKAKQIIDISMPLSL